MSISAKISWLIVITAIVVLIGWATGSIVLKSVSPNWPAMKPLTAANFILSAILLILFDYKKKSVALVTFFSVLIFLTGVYFLVDYFLNYYKGWKYVIYNDTADYIQYITNIKQSPFITIYFVIFGFTFIPAIQQRINILFVQSLYISGGVVGYLGVFGFIINSKEISSTPEYVLMAFHSSILLILLFTAALYARPKVGIMKVITSRTSGGRLIRTLIPLFVAAFIIIGFLRLKGEEAGLYNKELGISLFLLFFIFSFGIFILVVGMSFTKSELQIIKANRNYENAEKLAAIGSWEIRIDDQVNNNKWSRQMFNLFGVQYSKTPPSYQEFLEFLHPEDRPFAKKFYEQKIPHLPTESILFRTNPDLGAIKYLAPTISFKVDEAGKPKRYYGTLQDVSEQVEIKKQLLETNEQLGLLTEKVNNVREEERKRIGREIHDEIGQNLTVLKMGVSQIKRRSKDDAELELLLGDILEQLDGCIQSSKRICTDLRPSLIDDIGLIAALEWQTEEFEKRTSIKSEFITELNEIELPADYTIGIFRIYQESLTNIARHANATIVLSKLYIKEGKVVLQVKDNGKGFDITTLKSSNTLGIIGMKERVKMMNGSYKIISEPSKGTEITVVIPVQVI